MEKLPTDIIDNILSLLPIEPTLQSKRVCRTWRKLIGKNKTGLLLAVADLNYNLPAESGTEVKLYYEDEHEANPEKSYFKKTLTKLGSAKYSFLASNHIVGSCNGLVCLHSYNKVTKTSYCGICNPVTGEFLFLPGEFKRGNDERLVFGFGYLPSTNEYKVVRRSYMLINGVRQGNVAVYTLGSQNGWREKEDIPYLLYSSGLFGNGVIHWLGKIGEQVPKIVAFDLADEKFKYVSAIPLNSFTSFDTFRLSLLGGNLCFIHNIWKNFNGRDQILDIWALKKRNTGTKLRHPKVTREHYSRNWRWSKDFHIAFKHLKMYGFTPFAITKSNDVLLWHEYKKLYIYDKNTSTLTKLWDGNGNGNGFSHLQAIPHMNTLVSLKDLGECGQNPGSNISTTKKKRKSY
ncbi:F-box protein At3g07870-like [Papaver somniferum]|uniref:F-box protein At3g07870-like n=1 Tax=Papaver somniferum TaxID=3469 RepID=UPI000E6FA3E2|nr:F-box protein At3g07870-like [Papaver somniferum]